jgi:ABC-type lipoprotein export system ATPase subunit
MTILELRDVQRVHGSGATAVHALRGVTLHVGEGELVAVMGPSGSGKSTMLNLAGGLDRPTRGEVAVGGMVLGGLSRRALVGERRLLLADEPTGALDPQTGESVLRLLRAKVDEGAAGVLVTHEARHAAWADRVVFLRDGVIVDTSGPLDQPDELLTTPTPGGAP